MEMIDRPCPLCGCGDTSRVFAEADFDLERLDSFAFASRKLPEYMHYRLVECPACDLLYASPVPAGEALAENYGEAAFDSGEEAHYAAATYGAILSRFAGELPDRRGALDVGTGDGAFLEILLAHGFQEVQGVEPSRAPIAAAREDVRPLIREGIFRPQDYPSGSFSLVTCFMTLEHLSDPKEMAEAALELLKPGGAAFFVCHDRRALPSRVMGLKSPIFDIEHLQLFSPTSARCLLEGAGFSEVTILPVLNSYPLRYWMRLLPLPRRVKEALIAAANRAGLGGILLPVRAGNLAVIGRKML